MNAGTTEMIPTDYAAWLGDLKARIHVAQQCATRAVNTEMIALYWHIGHDILERQNQQGWGAKVIERLSKDLRSAFPEMKGFSVRNLLYMRAFAEAWADETIVQGVLAQLPWYHHLALLDKLSTADERLAYIYAAIEHGWSRNVLVMHIETQSLERSGKALTNFNERLPKPQSDLAHEALKDPYKLDFLGLGIDAREREIENALVDHITRFLIELGVGFAYVGKQIPLEVGGQDFFIDLLFYHLTLRCYVVIELKAGDFKPEHTGQLSFYLSAVDTQVKHADDQPTIGLLLCKSRNKIVAEYALRDMKKPIGIAEYELVNALPQKFETALPSIEDIEAELGCDDDRFMR
ncbi:hypothetical protein FACS189485_21790 [Spirochaetia bacterium]|nr:hypothetical protein FACS189485_21790 [Spirochaetia bacterium]